MRFLSSLSTVRRWRGAACGAGLGPAVAATGRRHAAPTALLRGSRLSGSRLNGSTERGITLIELLVTITIVALMVSISYPTMTRGLDGIRLKTAVDRAGTFFNAARQAANRRQEPVQFTVDPERNQLTTLSADGDWEDRLVLDESTEVAFPPKIQSLILYPGDPPPEFRLFLKTHDGSGAGLKVNVFTGVPEEWGGPQDLER